MENVDFARDLPIEMEGELEEEEEEEEEDGDGEWVYVFGTAFNPAVVKIGWTKNPRIHLRSYDGLNIPGTLYGLMQVTDGYVVPFFCECVCVCVYVCISSAHC